MKLNDLIVTNLLNSQVNESNNNKNSENQQIFEGFFNNIKNTLLNNNDNVKFETFNQNNLYKNKKFEPKFNNNQKNIIDKKDYTNKYEKNIPENQEVVKSDEKKIDDDFNMAEKQEKSKDINKFIIFDKNKLDTISNILNVPSEHIMSVLAEMNIPISALETPENLINFLQDVLELDTPVKLLATDGIKDIMSQISDVSKSIDYNDAPENFDELINTLQNSNLKNLKIVDLTENNTEKVTHEVNLLLENLNGKVTDVNKLDIQRPLEEVKIDIKPELLNQNNSQNSEFSQNNAFSQNDLLSQNNLNNKENLEFDFELFQVSEISSNSKVFNASLPKTQVLRNINSTEVINQILEKLKTSVKPDMSEVKILLRPEHLGEVSLKIATQNGAVTAHFIAESQKVKEIIESNFNQLKDMLNEQGINVTSLEVNVSDEGESQGQFQQFENTSKDYNNNKPENNNVKEVDDSKEVVKNDTSQVDYAI